MTRACTCQLRIRFAGHGATKILAHFAFEGGLPKCRCWRGPATEFALLERLAFANLINGEPGWPGVALLCSLRRTIIGRSWGKRKIAEAGVPFEIARPADWIERLEAVLSTLEISYAKAHEDAAGASVHAGFATEILQLTQVLAELLPNEPEALALAAMVRFSEARRPARLDDHGAMVPLSEQDPAQWKPSLIEAADGYLRRALILGPAGSRAIQAAIHGTWCARRSLATPPPWREVLALYDRLLAVRDDVVVRINRAVAVSEVDGPQAALNEIEHVGFDNLQGFLPFQAVRADLLRRLGRFREASVAYDAALALRPTVAEKIWLERRKNALADT